MGNKMKQSLILIDYINEICHKEGAFGCYPMLTENQSVAKLNRILSLARKENWLVIWIIVGFDKHYLEANAKSPIFSKAKKNKKLQRGTWGTEIISDLDYQEGELIIYKNVVSAFYGTNLDHVLRTNEVEEVYIAGVSTEVAVQSAVRDAHDRGYTVNVISDCCGSSHKARHDASLEMLTYMANVIGSSEIG
jgi:ureidoacrylate peracid hydrolase